MIFHAMLAAKSKSVIDIFFDTYGIWYGNTARSAITTSRSEKILVLFIAIVALLASIKCTGMFFSNYAQFNVGTIKNFTELATKQNGASKQPLCFSPIYRDFASKQFGETVFSFHSMLDPDILYQIYNGNRSCIYITSEQKFNDLMGDDDIENKVNQFYIVPNIYLCKFFFSMYKKELNVIFYLIDGFSNKWMVKPEIYARHIQAVLVLATENGIRNHFEKESQNVVLQSFDKSQSEISVQEISMDQLRYTF